MNLCVFYPEEWGMPLAASDERHIHIKNILGLRCGDSLRVGLVGLGSAEAVLASEPSDSSPLELEFPPRERLSAEWSPELRIIIGHPRPPVFQRLLRDLTASGAAELHWVHTELSEKSYLASKAWEEAALRRQIRLGLEQGMRCIPPVIHKHYSLNACLKALEPREAELRIVLHPSATENGNLFSYLCNAPRVTNRRIVLALGPERGWSDSELEQLTRNEFTAQQLGSGILRTESACIASASLALQYLEACSNRSQQ